MAQRVTLRKRQPYNTKSNRRRVVKTPGGKLVYHHLKKRGTAPKCGDCGIALPGVRPRLFLMGFGMVNSYFDRLWCLDPRSPAPPIRHYLQATKDCKQTIWRLSMW